MQGMATMKLMPSLIWWKIYKIISIYNLLDLRVINIIKFVIYYIDNSDEIDSSSSSNIILSAIVPSLVAISADLLWSAAVFSLFCFAYNMIMFLSRFLSASFSYFTV